MLVHLRMPQLFKSLTRRVPRLAHTAAALGRSVSCSSKRCGKNSHGRATIYVKGKYLLKQVYLTMTERLDTIRDAACTDTRTEGRDSGRIYL